MTWLWDDPTLILSVGVLIEGLLGVVLFQTGRGWVLAAMLGILVCVLAAVAVEYFVVTPREEVENTLAEVAAALEANDLPSLLGYLADDGGQIRASATDALSRFKVREARIRNLRVTVDLRALPPRATADFHGLLTLDDPRGQVPYEHFARDFTVFLEQRSGRWLLVRYEDRDLRLPK